ncbi:MAG TPA: MFS transporter [Terrimicrobiaceae bacterium]
MSKQTNKPLPQGSPLAVAVMFLGNGLVMASSLSRMPEIRDHVGATPTSLAFALVCVGIGSILGMPFTGRLVDRYSSKTVSRVSTAICLGGWALVPLTNSVPALALILLVVGLGTGVGDVAMNVQGNLVEQRRGSVLMPYWHGLFSLGAVFGALAGALAASLGLALAWQLPAVSVALMAAMWLATAFYVPDSQLHLAATKDQLDEPVFDEPQVLALERPPVAETQRSSITRVEILLGIIVFGTAVGEGAANDWLALMLVDNRGAPAAFGALTYAGFNVTMAIGRFAGGVIIQRFGRGTVLRVAGLLASAGVAALCLVPSTAIALLGALAWGLGLSVVFPSAMSAAGELPGRGSRAIAVVSTIGYGGFLLGAPLIGLLAHQMPLDRALLVVSVLVLPVAVLASVARERSPRRPTTTS